MLVSATVVVLDVFSCQLERAFVLSTSIIFYEATFVRSRQATRDGLRAFCLGVARSKILYPPMWPKKVETLGASINKYLCAGVEVIKGQTIGRGMDFLRGRSFGKIGLI